MSYSEIKRRLGLLGVDIGLISRVFITHEHADHISALKTMTKRQKISAYFSSKTYLHIGSLLADQTEIHFADQPFGFAGISVTPFPVSHDAADPVGYSFVYQGKKVSVSTDLGYLTPGVLGQMKNSDVLMIESNHDEEMLWNGPYAWPLKERIAGKNGHLSNRQSAEAIESVYHDGLKYVFLAHLSQENNKPSLALTTVNDYLNPRVRHRAQVLLTHQQNCSPVIHI